jgi:hypothetical protein
MKKEIFLILVILPCSIFAEQNQTDPNSILSRINKVESEITELQETIKEKKEHLEFLERMLPESIRIATKANKAIYGVYLGESLEELKSRQSIRFIKQKDELLSEYHVSGNNVLTNWVTVKVYNGRIMMIDALVGCADKSAVYAAKDMHEEDYGVQWTKAPWLLGQPAYEGTVKIGDCRVTTQLYFHQDPLYSTSNAISLTYYHEAICSKYAKEKWTKKIEN